MLLLHEKRMSTVSEFVSLCGALTRKFWIVVGFNATNRGGCKYGLILWNSLRTNFFNKLKRGGGEILKIGALMVV